MNYVLTHTCLELSPAIFDPEPLYCTACEEDDRSNQGKRPQGQGFLRPRVWLYNEFGFPDEDAISEVTAADIRTKPDAVIVVGTALKVPSAKLSCSRHVSHSS